MVVLSIIVMIIACYNWFKNHQEKRILAVALVNVHLQNQQYRNELQKISTDWFEKKDPCPRCEELLAKGVNFSVGIDNTFNRISHI